MKTHAVVALVLLEEERLEVVAVHLDGHTGAVVGHVGVVDVCDGVAAFLEAEPRAAHHEGDHTPMAHCAGRNIVDLIHLGTKGKLLEVSRSIHSSLHYLP